MPSREFWQQLCTCLLPQGPEKSRRCFLYYCFRSREGMMGKSVEKPKKHIISCRIDDQEMERLQKIARQSGTSISGLMRKTLTMLARNHG
jgi:hypothetical protein